MLWEKLSRARTNYFRLFGAKKIRLANLTDGPKLKTEGALFRHASLIFFIFSSRMGINGIFALFFSLSDRAR